MQILRKDPKSPVFAILSEAYRKGGLLDEAIATAVEGLKHNPNYISGRVALGRAYFDKGEMDKAVEELRKVIKATPDNIISHKLIADIYIKKSDIPAALQELKTVVYLSPDDKEAKKLIDSLSKPQPAAEKAPEPPPAAELHTEHAAQIPEEAVQKPAPREPVSEEAQPLRQPEEHAEPALAQPAGLQQPEPEHPVEDQHHEPAAEAAVPVAAPGPEPDKAHEQEPEAGAQVTPEPGEPSGSPADAADSSLPSLDCELESALSSSLEESKPDTVQAAAEQEPGAFAEPPAAEQPGAETVKEQSPRDILSGEPEEQPVTAAAPEPKGGVKEEELEAVFDNLTEIAQTPSEQQAPAPSMPADERAFSPRQETLSPDTGMQEYTTSVEPQTPDEQSKPAELHGEDIQTVTMADLYIKQGHLDKAYHIYRTILLKTPDSPVIRAKLVKVKKMMEAQQQDEVDKKKIATLKEREPKPPAAEQSDSMKENMKRLNAWLDKIKKGG